MKIGIVIFRKSASAKDGQGRTYAVKKPEAVKLPSRKTVKPLKNVTTVMMKSPSAMSAGSRYGDGQYENHGWNGARYGNALRSTPWRLTALWNRMYAIKMLHDELRRARVRCARDPGQEAGDLQPSASTPRPERTVDRFTNQLNT